MGYQLRAPLKPLNITAVRYCQVQWGPPLCRETPFRRPMLFFAVCSNSIQGKHLSKINKFVQLWAFLFQRIFLLTFSDNINSLSGIILPKIEQLALGHRADLLLILTELLLLLMTCINVYTCYDSNELSTKSFLKTLFFIDFIFTV